MVINKVSLHNIDESLGKISLEIQSLPCATHFIVGKKRPLGNETHLIFNLDIIFLFLSHL